MNRARKAEHAVRVCERFVYSTVKITRLYDDYQSWQKLFLTNSRGVQRFLGLFFRDCTLRVLIGWAGKLRSRGVQVTK